MNIKYVLLLCLSLAAIFALPAQSQTTPVPTAPPRLNNPTADDLDDCGLPRSYSRFNDEATLTTFNMTADCANDNWELGPWSSFFTFVSGEFTINGNGYSISGPTTYHGIWIEGANTVLNLNDVTIRETGSYDGYQPIRLHSGRLNGRNLTFENNYGNALLWVRGQVYLENVQFLDNRHPPSFGHVGIDTYGTSLVDINRGIFRGNIGNYGGLEYVVIRSGVTVRLRGCITYENNLRPDGTPVPFYSTHSTGQVIDRIDCSKPKTATPRPSATLRPPAMTCIDLHRATGIAVYATFGLASGVQCQQLNGGGVGIQSIVDAGFIDAVDVWGYVEQGVEVCFPQSGTFLFLDARTIPRAVSPLESYIANGMTCGWIESPGSIVLMPHP